MLLACAFCVALVILTTVVHFEALRLLNAGLPFLRMAGRYKLIVVILVAFIAHIVEVLLYASAYYILSHYFNAGTLGNTAGLHWLNCFYFSSETYTSLGYGDIVPHQDLRILAGVEALNGLLLIGWSASYTYIAMERFWHHEGK